MYRYRPSAGIALICMRHTLLKLACQREHDVEPRPTGRLRVAPGVAHRCDENAEFTTLQEENSMRFHKSSAPATLSFAALAALLTFGCTAPAQPAGPAVPAAPAADSGPVTPKINRVVVAAEGPSIESNETRNLSSFYLWQLRPMYEYGFGNDPKTGKTTPGLYAEWNLEPDGLSYRIKLRKGVKFHGDNGEFTVKDITTAWDETSKPDSLGGQNAVSKPSVKDWEKVNDYEVLLRLKDPNPQVLPAAGGSLAFFSSADMAKRGPGAITTAPNAGTGPYQYATRSQSAYVRFERAPGNHWSGVRPDFPELEIRFIKEASTRLAALLTNEVQVTDLPEDLKKEAINRPNFKLVPALASTSRVLVQPHGGYYKDLNNLDLGMKFPDSPMADVRFRKALSKAIDRDALNKAFFGGKAKINVRMQYAPTWPGWNPDWEKRFQDEYGYDPAAAKKLLTDAGFGPNKPATTTVLLAPADGLSNSLDILEALAGYWRAIGIDVKLENMDGTTMTLKYRNADFPNHIRIRATGADQWTGITSYDSGIKPTRAGGMAIPEGDKILQQILQTLDEKKLDDLIRQAGNIWYDQHVEVPLFSLVPEVVVNSTIVAGYDFPGNVSGGWTHMENLKAAR